MRRHGASARVPAAVAAQAPSRPNSWVYEVDQSAGNGGPVSAAQIRRAWRTDDAGAILAEEYVENPYYRPVVPPPRRHRRTGILVAASGLALAGGAVLVLVLTGSSHSARIPATRARPASAPVPVPVAGAATRTQVRRAQARPAVVPGPPLRPRHRTPARSVLPRVSLRATAPVWVCVQDGRGQVLVNGETLTPGQMLPALRGSAFEIFAGNGHFTMVVNGVAHPASGSSDPVAYRVHAGTVSALPGYPAQPCA